MGNLNFQSIAAAVLFILSLGYLGAETIFNMSLLDVAGSIKSSPQDIDSIQHFGRSVSAFGCYLLLIGLFSAKKFSLRGKREYRLLLLIGAVCIAPFFLIVFGKIPATSETDVAFALMPFLGILLVAYGRLRVMPLNVIGLFLMIWSTVYTGQKLLIEELLIDRTGWEQRVNARYALMLRSGFETCAMSLDDLQLCDKTDRQDVVKSARIILGALWMLNPDGIRRDMIENREKLVESVAMAGLGSSMKENYQKYLGTIEERRNKYRDEMLAKYYKPYSDASKMYLDSQDPEKMDKAAEEVANDIDRKVSAGFDEYTRGVQDFRQTASAMAMNAARKVLPWQKKVQQFCNGRRCPSVVNNDTAVAFERAQGQAEMEFQNRTGYPSNLGTREIFEAHPQTQGMIRAGLETHIQDKMGIGFVLPYHWRYDRQALRDLFRGLGQVQVNTKWKEKFGGLPPGLTAEDFFVQLGYPPLPEVSELAMNENDFFHKILLPRYKQAAVQMFDTIEAEKMSYANGAILEAQGRDYVRAAYIPAISLVVSLIVVTITIVRWSAVGIALAIRRSDMRVPRPVRYGVVGCFVVLLLLTPYLAPNAYIKGTAYQRYLKGAKEGSPAMATVLDWAIHAQPIIYRFGTPLRKLLD